MKVPNQITEQQIINLKSKLNNKKIKCSEIEFPDRGVHLTKEQTIKGITWLKKSINKRFFGYRELAIIEDFKEFRLIDFKDDSLYNSLYPNYFPVYKVISNSGDTFDYYYNLNKINITG